VDDDPRWQCSVLKPVLCQCSRQQTVSAIAIEVNLSILLLIHSSITSHNDSVPPFVENLGDTGINPFLVETAKKSYANEACLQLVGIVRELPG
jgi:hypothetical protein